MQNKMHFAVHGHTAAELIVDRADADEEHMGLTTWEKAPNGKIVKADVSIAKNYLKESALDDLGKPVTPTSAFAPPLADRPIPMTTPARAQRIDIVLAAGGDAVLKDAGEVTAEYAKE